jgi:hypothetical protein
MAWCSVNKKDRDNFTFSEVFSEHEPYREQSNVAMGSRESNRPEWRIK